MEQHYEVAMINHKSRPLMNLDDARNRNCVLKGEWQRDEFVGYDSNRWWRHQSRDGRWETACGVAWTVIIMDMFVCLLFYAIATVFQLDHGGDMMYEMRRRRKPEATLLLTQGTFNFPHHIGIIWEELAFDNAVSYIQQGNGHQYSALNKWAISPPGFKTDQPAV